MELELGLKSVKVEPPLTTQITKPQKACGVSSCRRAAAVGLLAGTAVLLVAHKQYAFVPDPWLEGYPHSLQYDKLSSKGAEDLFL